MKIIELLNLIPPSKKKGLVFSSIYAIIKAVLDIASLAAIISLLIIILNSATVLDKYIPLVLIGIGLVVLTKSIVVYFINIYQSKYNSSLYNYFSHLIFTCYFHKGVSFAKSNNSNILTYNVMQSSYIFTYGIVNSLINSVKDTIIILLSFSILCYINIYLFVLSILIFSLSYISYKLIFSSKLKKIGNHYYSLRQKQYKSIQESFKGIAEHKINGTFPSLVARIRDLSNKSSLDKIKIDTISSIPWSIMEVSAVILICISTAYYLLNGRNLKEFTLFIGVGGVAFLKAYTAIRGVMTTINTLDVNKKVINIIKETVQYSNDNLHKSQESSDLEQIEFGKSIAFKDVCFSYPGSKTILQNLSFNISKGDVVGITGNSGTGKTTLLYLLMGFYLPSKGSIQIDGKDLDYNNLINWHKQVSYVSQNVFVIDGSILENITLGEDKYNLNRLNNAINTSKLVNVISELPNGINSIVGENGSLLSGGQIQRIGISRALYNDSEIILLDEATASLDKESEQLIIRELLDLSAIGKTIIIVTHRKDILDYCNNVINLCDNDG